MEANKDDVIAILYTLGVGLRTIALLIHAFFPEKMSELLTRIGRAGDIPSKTNILESLLSSHPDFLVSEKGTPLFPRVQ